MLISLVNNVSLFIMCFVMFLYQNTSVKVMIKNKASAFWTCAHEVTRFTISYVSEKKYRRASLTKSSFQNEYVIYISIH